MEKLELQIQEQLKVLVPKAKNIELHATVSDSSYAIEFIAEVDGKKMQCYDMADNGLIDEDELNQVLAEIADGIRKDASCKKGEVNKLSFTF